MILLLMPVAIIVATVIWAILDYWDWVDLQAMLLTLSSIWLIAQLICFWAVPYNRTIRIQQIEQQRPIVENRQEISEFERIQFFKDVLSVNDWIVEMKIRNKNILFDHYIPDEIEELELLK